MLINLHLEIDNNSRPDEIAAALKLATVRAEPYLLALGRPLRVDESISLEDEMKGRLASIIDCSIARSGVVMNDSTPTHQPEALLAQAVLDLNRGWNAKETEALIGERIGLCRRLADRSRSAAPVAAWQPIEAAPKDGKPILGWCVHSADAYYDGDCLTDYGARTEGLSHVEDGPHVLMWGESYEVSDGWENPSFTIPAGWELSHDCEVMANPTHWMPLPKFAAPLATPLAPAETGLELDAKRYQWLRSGTVERQGCALGNRIHREINRSRYSALLSFRAWCDPEELDAAIDAALATQPQPLPVAVVSGMNGM